ncbi:hypothetical protein PVK06_049974 [Gossypium arboreum]|uniref:NADH:quinone oxidoreductase/Mrp antiporter membrane subunit domain-containing protein n=1 Tax=Gossypium arboreum TaxID=29729 RepID=A0ABR0MBS6_GOSAR|nr:hypothetical protein PVK06_049974 [Gossypium arboreum]
MAFKLSSELVDAAKGSGDAIRKKEETHRMAEANRAFAHFPPECFSLCSYLLSGYTKKDVRSNEATTKYLLMGGASSSILVHGFSWLYGSSGGEIELQEIVNGLINTQICYNSWFSSFRDYECNRSIRRQKDHPKMIISWLLRTIKSVGTFACIVLFGLRTGTDNIRDYAGLYTKDPFFGSLFSSMSLISRRSSSTSRTYPKENPVLLGREYLNRANRPVDIFSSEQNN